MAVITPRNGATLAQVVQTALNVAGRQGVSIETGGTGNGVRVPDVHLSEIEDALGWTEAEGKPHDPTPTQEPTNPPTQEPTRVEAQVAAAPDDSDQSDPSPDTDQPQEQPAVAAPAKKSAPAKKTTSSRRARRGKEG